MKVLLSVKPEFANKIFSGVKKYEYRRAIFKNNVNRVIVYASSPVQKLIGEFEIESIIYENLEQLWERTKEDAGISKEYFFEYFSDKKMGYAISVKNLRKYKQPLCLKETYGVNPPQSFLYINN
jgi:predicted transcriptional regulator